jgi:protein arginine kinase activator
VRVLDSGRVGCTECYTAFAAEIEPMLNALHGSTTHRGKVSRVGDVRTRLRADLQTKRALLRSALETENYEEAAALRDDIRQLEMRLPSSATPTQG